MIKRQILFGSVIALSALLNPAARAAVYGDDNRKDIAQVPRFAHAASGVAVAVGSNLITKNADGTSKIEVFASYGDGKCQDEKFVHQPSIGVCSGFLITDRLLVTAGHCGIPTGTTDDPQHPFCENFSWVFGYQLDSKGHVNLDRVPADRIYGCKRLLRAENIEPVPPSKIAGNDFMILELDRPVTGGATPSKIAERPPRLGELVYTIGFPGGAPAKYSGVGRIRKTEQPHYFEANLDTLSGNSGGPVFNLANELVGILVSGHQMDTYLDKENSCIRVNTCDESGKKCIGVPEVDLGQTSNFVQRIETLKPYLNR